MNKVFSHFVIISLLFIFLNGCTAMINKPHPPNVPNISFSETLSDDIHFPEQSAKSILRYKSISKNPIKSGNIVAKVEVQQKNKSTEIIKNIICDSPSGGDVKFQPVGTYMILSLTNKSQRIYKLNRTVIQIEDDRSSQLLSALPVRRQAGLRQAGKADSL